MFCAIDRGCGGGALSLALKDQDKGGLWVPDYAGRKHSWPWNVREFHFPEEDCACSHQQGTGALWLAPGLDEFVFPEVTVAYWFPLLLQIELAPQWDGFAIWSRAPEQRHPLRPQGPSTNSV